MGVLLPVAMAVCVLVGCGQPQETMGSAEGTVKEESAGTTEVKEDNESAATQSEEGEESVTTQSEEYKEVTTVTILAKDLEYDSDGNIVSGCEYGILGKLAELNRTGYIRRILNRNSIQSTDKI